MSTRALIWLAVLVTVVLAVPETAGAIGVGAFPPQVELTGALRGGTVSSTIGIINDSDEPRLISVSVEGEIAEWLSVRRTADPEVPVTGVLAPPRDRVFIEVVVEVPEDAANGRYTARLEILSRGEAGAEGDSAVAVGVAVPLTVEVEGTQRLEASFLALTAEDTEVGVPLRFTAVIENTGNVLIRPVVMVELRTGNTPVDSVSTDGGELDVGVARIEGEWDTSTARPGAYVAVSTVDLGDRLLGPIETPFTLYDRGHFTRQGRLIGLALDNEPQPGGVAVVNVSLENTGSIEARAVFRGEVVRDGVRLDEFESLQKLLTPAEVGSVQVFIEVDEPGAYIVRGQAWFGDDFASPIDSLSFVVIGPESNPIFTRPGFLIAVAGGLAAATLVGVFFAVRGYRNRRPARPLGKPRK